MLAGEAPGAFEITVDGLVFEVDLLQGQKTGFYLDQAPNYAAVAAHAAGRKVLGPLASPARRLRPGLRPSRRHPCVQAIEISAECVELVKRNARRNELLVEAYAANVFDLLNDLERQQARYDLIILDPPSFTKSKGTVGDAMRGYKEIHLRALKLLNPDGLLATFCCLHHVTRDIFMETSSMKRRWTPARRFASSPPFPRARITQSSAPSPRRSTSKDGSSELAPGRLTRLIWNSFDLSRAL